MRTTRALSGEAGWAGVLDTLEYSPLENVWTAENGLERTQQLYWLGCDFRKVRLGQPGDYLLHSRMREWNLRLSRVCRRCFDETFIFYLLPELIPGLVRDF